MRIGLVAYANAAPLAHGLPEEELLRGTPSRVADALATGEVDVALLPTIELTRMPGLAALPSYGVAADGHCGSVLLFTKVPLSQVRRITLDADSRTSSALSLILLEREGARDVEQVRISGGSVEQRLSEADATLLIGDPALRAIAPEGVSALDLATEWKHQVGLPFVFAVWATRAGSLSADDLVTLEQAAERGLADLPAIAAAEALRTSLDEARMLDYLQGLQYRLTENHLRGLRAFLDEAHRVGILTEQPEVRFFA